MTTTQRVERASGAPDTDKSAFGVRSARAFWRWLTSMRTALVLLLVLAVAAVPGSVWPQRNVSAERVTRYYTDHPSLAPLLDRFWFFDVYASPWFSAVYLLLFVSLVGCLVPRLRQHAQNLVKPPPQAPVRLDRLPHSARRWMPDDAATAAQTVRSALRGRRWRTTVRAQQDGAVTVAAEKGYLKESGNLLFHFALLAVLFGVAWGSWYGWHANRLVVAGDEFCDTTQQYDEYGLGARTVAEDLPPFCVTVQDFTATYLDTGEPSQYTAHISYVEHPGAAARGWTLRVNDPLRLSDANVYLLGHGYAPVLRYTDRYGKVFTTVVPFLPTDGMLTSEGVAKFPYANVAPGGGQAQAPAQVGFSGVYQPTVNPDPAQPKSIFPDERDPALTLRAWEGDLGLGNGAPQSVYELDSRQIALGLLNDVGTHTLRPGQSWALPDGSTVEFLGTKPWITVAVRYDPGEKLVLAGAACLLIGLMISLSGKRRRIWARISPADGGGSLITIGGLARTDHPGFGDEFAGVVRLAGGDPPAQDQEPAPVGTSERGR
ncbi:MAG TPA: cytochrome c biogenesis protein ResB [Micromonosporaceae bacterium]|jgi:cytochrome c biogenesis protein